MKLFVAIIYCDQFATFKKPMKPVAIPAMSHDEAVGMAIALCKRTWSSDLYSNHNADVVPVPQETLDQVMV